MHAVVGASAAVIQMVMTDAKQQHMTVGLNAYMVLECFG